MSKSKSKKSKKTLKDRDYTLPSQVRIFGKTITIAYTDESQGFADCGQFDDSRLGILIREGQLPIEEADTVLHESLHGLDFVMDLDLTEHQVRSIATGLIGMFQDNPEFARFITRQIL